MGRDEGLYRKYRNRIARKGEQPRQSAGCLLIGERWVG